MELDGKLNNVEGGQKSESNSAQNVHNSEFKNVLVGCTGSVASMKVPELATKLKEFANVQVVATDHAMHFFNPADVPVPLLTDKDEWTMWKKRSDPVMHIELRRWADLLIIAPLDANTMAKLANGICDNLLTCTVRAWDLRRPLLFAPAMNTLMWEHPITSKQVEQLQSFGYKYIPTIEKLLVCGDKGAGGMAEVDTVVRHVRETLDDIQ